MKARAQRPQALFAFPRHAAAGRRLARRLGWSYRTVQVRTFPDGESLVRLPAQAWTGPATLLVSLDDPNRRLVECLLALRTLRERGAGPISLLAPYLAYMRQDVAFRPGEAVSQRTVLSWLGAHVDRLVTVDPHLHRTEDLAALLGQPLGVVSAAPAIAAHLRGLAQPTLVGPDEESAPWTRAVAEAAEIPYVIARKARRGDRDVTVRLPRTESLRGRTVVVIDDIASTGHTIAATARALATHRPRRIVAAVVHAILVEGALQTMRRAGVRQVLTTNTIPHETNAIDVMPLLATSLQELEEDRR